MGLKTSVSNPLQVDKFPGSWNLLHIIIHWCIKNFLTIKAVNIKC